MRLKIAPVLKRNLLRMADAYIEAVRPTNAAVSLQSVSRRFHGDPPFFKNLRAGKCSFGVEKYDEVIDRFEAGWPKGDAAHRLRPKLEDPRHGPMRRKRNPKRGNANGKKGS